VSSPAALGPSELFVISDLHIGGKYGTTSTDRGFRINTHVKELVTFIGEVEQRVRQQKRATEIVINGDFVDFLAEEGPEPRRWRAFIDDEEEAVAALETIVKRDVELFDALGLLLQSGATLTLVLGNHDIELSRPGVRSRLRELLKVEPASPFQFIYDGEAYVVRDVLIEHGNRYDGWNVVDFDRLRRSRSEDSRRLPISTDAKFIPPAGSQMVAEVMNLIKQDYPFVDLLKPETEAAIPLLLALEPGYASSIERIETVRLLNAEANKRAPKAPARPAHPENIAAAGSGRHPQIDNVLTRQMGARQRQRLLALVQEAEGQSTRSGERIAAGATRRFLSFARMLLTKDLEKRMPTLLDSLRAWQGEDVFNWSVETVNSYLDAAKELASGGFSTIIFGHTHLAKIVDLKNSNTYLNTGTWADLLRLPAPILKASQKEALASLKGFTDAMRTGEFRDFLEFMPTFGYIRWDATGRSVADLKRYEAGIVKSL